MNIKNRMHYQVVMGVSNGLYMQVIRRVGEDVERSAHGVFEHPLTEAFPKALFRSDTLISITNKP